jgi:hypothetical protein
MVERKQNAQSRGWFATIPVASQHFLETTNSNAIKEMCTTETLVFIALCSSAAELPNRFTERISSRSTCETITILTISCVIDGCVEAPLTGTELEDHLRTTHDVELRSQPHLDITLAALNLRRTWLPDGSVLPEENDKCPLAFLGCDLRHSTRDYYCHLPGHELVQRSEAYEAIVALYVNWPSYSVCTCPICDEKLAWRAYPKDLRPFNSDFLVHLENHSKEERALHAAPISKMLRPYLIGKETFCTDAHIFHKLRAELEEVSIPYKAETAGNNQ